MSTLLAGAVVATAMLSNCSWNSPGRNPYRGTVREAVTRYVDLPAPVRAELIARIEGGRVDDTVAIMRDSIAGKYDYSPQITGMHFGQRTMCESVTRDGWVATRREPAAVYCVGEDCLIVPKICGNISRVRRVAGGGGRGGGAQAGAALPGPVGMTRPADPGFVHAASADDVAMADAMAQVAAAGSPESTILSSSAFASPFYGASYGMRLGGRGLASDTGLAQPSPVPEPATPGMLGAGLLVVAGMAWRRASRRAARR